MNAIQQALDCLKNGNRTWEAMDHLVQSLKQYKETEEVLRQLRAELEALTLQVEEQRRLLEQALDSHNEFIDCGPQWGKRLMAAQLSAAESERAITQHLKGKE